MAKVFLLSALLVGLLLFVADASRNTQLTDKESDVTYIVEGSREGSNEAAGLNVVIPSKHGLQDKYCCLKDGLGSCVQECDSKIKYYCCLKTGLGGCKQLCETNVEYFCCLKNPFGTCFQLCDSSKEHYCCKKNVSGSCVGMCPKTVNLMNLPCHCCWIVHWETSSFEQVLILVHVAQHQVAIAGKAEEAGRGAKAKANSKYLEWIREWSLEEDGASSDIGSFVWSTNTGGSGAQVLALESSGNLVIRSKIGDFLWQSFDHPCDAVLPGMKLVASISKENKEPGYFSLEVWSSDEEEEEISFLFLVNSSLEIHGTKGVMWSTPTIGGVTDQSGHQFLKIYSNGEPRFTSRSFSTGNSTKSINLNPLFFGKSSLTRTCGISFETAEGYLCIVHEVRFFRGQGGMQAPGRTCENSQHHYMLEATAKPAIVAVFSVATMAIIIIAMVTWKKQINSYLKHYKPSLVRVFNYPELLTATKAFSAKIASGGVGTVFEGILSVAVKRLESFSSQGYKQFKAEESHYFLVYEYVANGYKPREDTRFKIVEEIARGMCYLHEECSTRVLHLDIKPQNLLLDENFGVKIAEFGLSRMMRVRDKLDIYSFGILVLEVALSIPVCLAGGAQSSWRFEKLRSGKLMEMLEEKRARQEMEATSKAEKLLRIGVWCIQPDSQPNCGNPLTLIDFV
ncbi:hypothetical protein SELMODRAFT_438187 [Selaginella moellendorffii]|uniref:Protein kinase domain-containing protein n=1 Tax=Selaginella moellendorffii TaxID=88036 RepID=D8QUW1_SELML|nr:hypothetical protein SELMODRAFT_438187 [Selaginella moellendorffii]